ncbi:MAG: hypothetical protein PVS3B2_00030 [Candidatus Dormibacteraceae bacterium]
MKRATTCCTGECNQGRACPLLPPRGPVVVRMPPPRVQLTGGRIPRARRMRRFLRALRDFLTAPRFRA